MPDLFRCPSCGYDDVGDRERDEMASVRFEERDSAWVRVECRVCGCLFSWTLVPDGDCQIEEDGAPGTWQQIAQRERDDIRKDMEWVKRRA